MKKLFYLLSVCAFLSAAFQAYAVDRYMATTGVNTGDCSSEASPCLTLQYAMSQMNGGDTLYIEDGEYTTADNTIDQFHVPPSGAQNNLTVIRAKNIPCQDGVPCDEPLRVRFTGNARFACLNENNVASYVKFWGIRWNGITTYRGWNNIYFKQVASQGIQDGNNTAIAIMGNNNLLEDVVAFGKGRCKILFYDRSREAQTDGVDNFTYRSATQIGKVLGRNDGVKLYGGDGPISLSHSIFSDLAEDGVDGGGVSSNHINMHQIAGSEYLYSTPAPQLHRYDPLANGLKYPVRIEQGSVLATLGSGGARIGANITHKLGVDGTFKGEVDWDAEQQAPLWPWPEVPVKAVTPIKPQPPP